MKNHKMFSWLFLSLILSASGCFYYDDDDGGGAFSCVKGSGATETQILNLPNFTGIQLQNSVEVYVSQGSVQKVEVEGKGNLIDLLELDVQNGIWDIEFDRCVTNLSDFKVYITLPEIDFVGISGSGKVYGENQFDGDEISLRVSGSGDLDLALNVNKIDARISGSGTMLLEGFSDEFDLKISASGDYNAFGLETNRGEITINGSGDAEVLVNDYLRIDINGSGDVAYKGFPLLDVNINGSGDVINAN